MAESDLDQHATRDLLVKTAQDVPSAIANAASEAWHHPWDSTVHAAKVLGPSVAGGLLLGAVAPSRGAAEMAAGLLFSVPMVWNEYDRFSAAISAANQSGANIDSLAADLAKGTVSDATDIGLSFIGGGIGGHFGHKILTSESAMGAVAQNTHRSLLGIENKSVMSLSETPAIRPVVQRAFSTRIASLAETAADAKPQEMNTYFGSLHSHSYYSDGMNSPRENFQSAKDNGMQVLAQTDHNHDASRTGIDPKDPRAGNESGHPNIASAPAEYTQSFKDADAVTEPGKFVAMVGTEVGTIGHVGGGGGGHSHGDGDVLTEPNGQVYELMRVTQPDGSVHAQVYTLDGSVPSLEAKTKLAALMVDPKRSLMPTDSVAQAIADAGARDNSHYGGVNHSLIYEVPTHFVRTIRDNANGGNVGGKVPGVETPTTTDVKPSGNSPIVLDINDGDFKTLDQKLNGIKDTSGGDPMMIAAHPRFAADWDPNLPANLRGRDYGIKSYGGKVNDWLDGIGRRYVGIEVIKGEALNPHPVDHMKTTDLDPLSYAGYLDKGMKVAPYYGRDDHFGIPAARPAGTGFVASTLDKPSIMDAMRNRRVFSTTNKELLTGVMKANDQFMGTVFDQAATNELNINMKVGGNIDPNAQYKVTLFGDSKLGDGKLATPIQTKQLSGHDLLDTEGQVAFDKVQHTLGAKSAWYVEVQRTDPHTQNVDYMWTSPVWVQPMGAASHSLLTRAIVGAGSSSLLGGWK